MTCSRDKTLGRLIGDLLPDEHLAPTVASGLFFFLNRLNNSQQAIPRSLVLSACQAQCERPDTPLPRRGIE